ncbi:hypothetical protein FRAAL0913 [Frankia alni ACN14a]|uniref:Uncharacterized protein n=1 Tax=Frankia alni (strain DSM 45986 / CECT 9034 / ACN14a) TaxID=326424 RepID=Q0RS86_FRAAA|nr:hypothetical protein FRAAL0913 [Frankia alni ACN14a]
MRVALHRSWSPPFSYVTIRFAQGSRPSTVHYRELTEGFTREVRDGRYLNASDSPVVPRTGLPLHQRESNRHATETLPTRSVVSSTGRYGPSLTAP